ncbi:MAG: hypothetical protein WBC44_08785 [Planctomycetaceae bacterium]
MPMRFFTRCIRPFALLAAAGSAGIAFAAPPVDVGAAARGSTTVDRALESRARVLDRARMSGRATGDAAATGTLYDRGGMFVNGSANGAANAAAGGAAGGAAGSATVTTDRGPGAAAALGLDAAATKRNGHVASQLGSGRLGAELRGGTGVQLGRGSSRNDRRGGTQVETEGRGGLGLGFGWLKRDERRQTADGAGVSVETNGSADVRIGRGRGHDPARILSQADAHLARRLAQIDRMRDRAVELGDEALLQQADKLEVLARAQHTQRTTGEHTVGSAMRTFNEEGNGDETATEPTGTEPADSETTVNAGAEVGTTATAEVETDEDPVVQASATVEAAAEVEATRE